MGFFSRKTVAIPEIHVVERVVIGEPTRVDVYYAYLPGIGIHASDFRPKKDIGYYLNCADAFASSEDTSLRVEKHSDIVIGGEYFMFTPSQPIKVTKPKRAKGKS